jgi:hypothetical protein
MSWTSLLAAADVSWPLRVHGALIPTLPCQRATHILKPASPAPPGDHGRVPFGFRQAPFRFRMAPAGTFRFEWLRQV